MYILATQVTASYQSINTTFTKQKWNEPSNHTSAKTYSLGPGQTAMGMEDYDINFAAADGSIQNISN
jgi:hypothetical protein